MISSERLEEFQGNSQEDVPYDNIKCHKKPEFQPLFRRYIFRKTTGEGGQIDPPSLPPSRFRVKFFIFLI